LGTQISNRGEKKRKQVNGHTKNGTIATREFRTHGIIQGGLIKRLLIGRRQSPSITVHFERKGLITPRRRAGSFTRLRAGEPVVGENRDDQ